MKYIKMIVLAAVFVFAISLNAKADTARLQVIHNAADPAAGSVDIYVNDGLLLDNFAFRAATPFIDVPANVNLNIGVAPGNSNGPEDIIADFDFTLEEHKTYVAIANGVLDPSSFASNPDGMDIGFNIFARDNIRESSGWRHLVKLIAFHGSSDAPTVDIMIRREGHNTWRLYNNLTYGEFSGYQSVWARNYILDVTPGNDNSIVVASFEADLSGLGGGAAVVFASGFLNPANNQNGPVFGLFAALPNGVVVELPAVTSDPVARLQVIHNAADPAAAVVDIYVNDGLLLDNFAFRTATPFIDVPAEVNLSIGVAPATSDGPEDVIANFDVVLEDGQTYVVIANGVLDPGMFATNPDGLAIGFSLFPKDNIRERANWRWFTDIVVFHGATDAPTVDVRINRWPFGPLVNNLSYGEFSSYKSVLPFNYTLNVTPGNDNNTIVASFQADLSGLRGGSAVVFASGFLVPLQNQNGESFGLFAALPDGNVVEFPLVNAGLALNKESDDINLPEQFELGQNYPNPFNPTTTISFNLANPSQVTLKVYNTLGQEVETLVNDRLAAGSHQAIFDARDKASGTYFYRLATETSVLTKRMTLVK